MTLFFCRVGWSEKYEGGLVTGGGSDFNKDGEACNFWPATDGNLYGYVREDGNIAIDRLGAKRATEIDDITVVWCSTHPKKDENGHLKFVIVGWYKNATVYREVGDLGDVNGNDFRTDMHIKNSNGYSKNPYRIRASKNDATLLSIEERKFEIPRAKRSGVTVNTNTKRVEGGMSDQGQTWYADSDTPEIKEFIKKVKDYIQDHSRESDDNPRNSPPKAPRSHDIDKKIEVERVAIDLCTQHYEDLGYKVKSVEKDNSGWDLEATKKNKVLKIEVKGLSGSTFSIGLTPNEYKAFRKNSQDYRLAIVTNTLTSNPNLKIGQFCIKTNEWIIEGDDELNINITKVESAIISFD